MAIKRQSQNGKSWKIVKRELHSTIGFIYYIAVNFGIFLTPRG